MHEVKHGNDQVKNNSYRNAALLDGNGRAADGMGRIDATRSG